LNNIGVTVFGVFKATKTKIFSPIRIKYIKSQRGRNVSLLRKCLDISKEKYKIFAKQK